MFAQVKKILVNDQDVWKVIVMTQDCVLFCVEFLERGFVMVNDFPKVQGFVFFDNLTFSSTTRVDHTDLSLANFEIPTKETDSNNQFVYHNLKFSSKSFFKLTTVNCNAETKQLKELQKNKEMVTEIERNIRHIIN